MTKWEYMTVVADARAGFMSTRFDPQEITNRLNQLGNEQWELVSMFDTNMAEGGTRAIVAVLKRPRM